MLTVYEHACGDGHVGVFMVHETEDDMGHPLVGGAKVWWFDVF